MVKSVGKFHLVTSLQSFSYWVPYDCHQLCVHFKQLSDVFLPCLFDIVLNSKKGTEII